MPEPPPLTTVIFPAKSFIGPASMFCTIVAPAQAGVQSLPLARTGAEDTPALDTRFRGYDEEKDVRQC
jgi:hypothetical protein